jgi:hypothetical protein
MTIDRQVDMLRAKIDAVLTHGVAPNHYKIHVGGIKDHLEGNAPWRPVIPLSQLPEFAKRLDSDLEYLLSNERVFPDPRKVKAIRS